MLCWYTTCVRYLRYAAGIFKSRDLIATVTKDPYLLGNHHPQPHRTLAPVLYHERTICMSNGCSN